MPAKRKAAVIAEEDDSKNEPPTRRVSARGKAAAETARAAGEEKIGVKPTTVVKTPAKKKNKVAKTGLGNAVVKDTSNTADSYTNPKSKFTTTSPETKPTPTQVKPPPKKAAPKSNDLIPQSYTDARALELFTTYADAEAMNDEEPTISPEGLMRLCEEADIPLEGPRPLLLAWICNAKKMGNIFRSEWLHGMSTCRIDTLAKLSLAMSDIETQVISPSPESMSTFPCGNLQELYLYVFELSKAVGQRNLEIETAVALWSVLLLPRFPLTADILCYITEMNGDDKPEDNKPAMKKYKGITKDQWKMTWLFLNTVDTDLSEYDADGGWPTFLDEFVEWKKLSAIR